MSPERVRRDDDERLYQPGIRCRRIHSRHIRILHLINEETGGRDGLLGPTLTELLARIGPIHKRSEHGALLGGRFLCAKAQDDSSLDNTVFTDTCGSRMDTPALPFCHYQLTGRKPSPLPYPALLTTLGDHLRKRRLDLGLLQKDLAEKLRVDEMTICNWETNRTSPQLHLIPKVIAFLGYDPHDTQLSSLGERIVA